MCQRWGNSPFAAHIGHTCRVSGRPHLTRLIRLLIQRLLDHLTHLDLQIAELEQAILREHRENEACQRLAAIPSIGPITATALVANLPSCRQRVADSMGRHERPFHPGNRYVHGGRWRNDGRCPGVFLQGNEGFANRRAKVGGLHGEALIL
ncbi:protein of unknown function [Denitratisoma oestradiolicum]|uniref:Transposase n=1 Tax=Denitratisoma oestradiolicum TaxID=311182 RepID=A0A6S6Y145_9PROT|nr:protein of unknown function [Denitratisoma oestradiolicum]